MSLKVILVGLQVALAILLMLSVLLQPRGASLSETFGGSGAVFGTRRGGEKALFTVTIILAVAFVLLSLIVLAVS